MISNCRKHLILFACILTLIFSSSLFSQSGSISGKIVNSDDQSPLSNVNVILLDKSIKISTNSEGTYELTSLSPGVYTLQASCVGFKTFRSPVTIGDTKITLDIQLKLEPIGMGEVVVTGYRESYSSGDSYSASRIDAPLMMLPLSTGQITGNLIEDQNVQNANDALRNVSGVAVEFGGPSHPTVVNIRGFSATILKDGFRMGGTDLLSPAGGDLPIDVSSLERIEVLKGPSAILYGRGEPGGVINFISKKPQMESEYSIEAQTGSFQQYQVNGSATGSLFNQDFIAYRLDGSYDRGNSYRDVVKSNSYFFKPSFLIKVSTNTQIQLSGEFTKSEYTPDRGVEMLPYLRPDGSLTADFAPISSRSYFFGENSDSTNQNQQRSIIQIDHIINPNWTIRASASYEQTHQETSEVWDWYYTYQGATPPGFPPGVFPPDWMVRPINTLDSKRTDYGARIENVFHIRHSLFDVEVIHGILAVIDWQQIETNYILDYSPYGILDPATGARIQMVVPIYPHEAILAKSKDYGIAIQDLITINRRWNLLLGGRFERNTIDVNQLAAFNPVPNITFNGSNGFAPRLGLLYQVQDNISLFASYMGSYLSPGADLGLWDIPADLKPERAYQTEAGVKVELFNRRVLVTTSVFLINKYDVISQKNNPNPPPEFLYFNIGQEDAKGFDIDIVGEIFSNLRVSAAFNTQTMKFTDSFRPIVDGKESFGTPNYSGNLWALYEFTSGMLNGFGVGAGFTTKGSVWANDADEVKLPAYTTFDAVTYYEFAKIRFQLNLYNITNELYYTAGNIGGFGDPTYPFTVMPSAPFRSTFSVRYKL